MMTLAIGMGSQPASALTNHTYTATIYVVTDEDCGYSHSGALSNTQKVKDYLDSNVHTLKPSTRSDYWIARYVIIDLGKNWDTSDVSNDESASQMLDDLAQDFGQYSSSEGYFVIGYTDKMDHNGMARRSANVCIVAHEPDDWYDVDWTDKNVALHELGHIMGDLSSGENGHVDKYKWSPNCVMNYYRYKKFYYCGSCKDDMKSQALNYWPHTTSSPGPRPIIV
jgi:hypothetical protein